MQSFTKHALILLASMTFVLLVLPSNALAATADAQITGISGLPEAPGYGDSVPEGVTYDSITVTLSPGSGDWTDGGNYTISDDFSWSGDTDQNGIYDYGEAPQLSFPVALDSSTDNFDSNGGSISPTPDGISSIVWTSTGTETANVTVTYDAIAPVVPTVPATPTVSWARTAYDSTTATLTFTFSDLDDGVSIVKTNTDHINVLPEDNLRSGSSVVASQSWSDSEYVVNLESLVSGTVYNIVCANKFQFTYDTGSGDVDFLGEASYTHIAPTEQDDDDSDDGDDDDDVGDDSDSAGSSDSTDNSNITPNVIPAPGSNGEVTTVEWRVMYNKS